LSPPIKEITMRTLTPVLLGLLVAFDASAASHRTFVSADGMDSGACGPTAPCRTLTYALSQTNDGGEIIITQSGGYGDASGGVTINKSVSIIAEPGVFAALAPTSGSGITIATAGIDVAIKNLTINGRGGSNGIHMTNGTSLDLDNVTISNFPAGAGLRIQTSARGAIKDSMFRRMSEGIQVGYGANLLVRETKLTDIASTGISISGGTSGSTTTVTATDTLVRCSSAQSGYGFDNHASSGTLGKMYLDQVTASNCAYGLVNSPAVASGANVVAVSNSFVTGNTYGLYNLVGSTFLSSGNNHFFNITADIFGSITTGTILK
jgi:hypothetical protein